MTTASPSAAEVTEYLFKTVQESALYKQRARELGADPEDRSPGSLLYAQTYFLARVCFTLGKISELPGGMGEDGILPLAEFYARLSLASA